MMKKFIVSLLMFSSLGYAQTDPNVESSVKKRIQEMHNKDKVEACEKLSNLIEREKVAHTKELRTKFKANSPANDVLVLISIENTLCRGMID